MNGVIIVLALGWAIMLTALLVGILDMAGVW